MKRILIATTHPMLAKGLESLLAAHCEVLPTSSDLLELFEALSSKRPDMAIVDMRVLPTLEVIRELRRSAPYCQMVHWPNGISRQQVNQAVAYGAAYVLASTASAAQLVEAIQLLSEFDRPSPSPAQTVKLSCDSEEYRLISLAGYGLDAAEIAAAVCSDESSVDLRLKQLASRLGAEDHVELALYGLSMLKEPGDVGQA